MTVAAAVPFIGWIVIFLVVAVAVALGVSTAPRVATGKGNRAIGHPRTGVA